MAKSKFKIALYQFVTRLRWQFLIATLLSIIFLLVIWNNYLLKSSLDDVMKNDFISYLGGISSIVTLFCSASFSFVIYFIQTAKSERLTTFSELKNKLREFDNYLFSVPDSDDKNICNALVYELEKLDISDLPQTDYGAE